MTKYRMFIGKADKHTTKQQYSDSYFKKSISAVLNGNSIAGYTIIESIGFWEGNAEKSLIVEINSGVPIDYENICKELKTRLNQSAIMVEVYKVQCEFI